MRDSADGSAQEADETPEAQPVLIVGAGPTGLLLAAELMRRGVPCHLIDAQPAPLHWDRATVLHPRSLQIFESLGLADEFLDAGCRQRAIKIHSGGTVLGTMDLSTCGSVYGFNLGLSEEVTERILTDYLQRQGGEVHRGSRLVGLTLHGDALSAEIECDGHHYHLSPRWVVGCDGIHSTTRELSGIDFEGHDIAEPWAVFDTTIDGWTETFEANFVYLDALPVILTALPDRRWRVYLRPSSEKSDLVADATSILRVYAPSASFIHVMNPTRFHCHTKVATRFRSGPVFLAGDAAHLCSPAEGHGMNCGLQDAFNLAWKLALVHHGADPALLDSYETERRPVAEMIAQSGDAAEHNLTMTDPLERDGRNQAMTALFADADKRHHEIVAETELNREYSLSPIVFGDPNSLLGAGFRLPDMIPVHLSDAQPSQLHKVAQRAGHTLMLLGSPAADASAFSGLYGTLQEWVRGSALFETAVAFYPTLSPLNRIGQLEPEEAAKLGVEGTTLLAVRPDGYIGLRSDRDHLRALERYRNVVYAAQR